MKKYSIYKKFLDKIMSFVLLAGFLSCVDYLDKAPQSDIDSNVPFQNFRNFQGFTEELYNNIPLLTGCQYHSNWNLADEEMWSPNYTYVLNYHIDRGNYWAWCDNTGAVTFNHFRPGGDPWDASQTGDAGADNDRLNNRRLYANAWYGIRTANVGIANLDKFVDGTQAEKDYVAGQLYFFRGFFHLVLMEYWGGLPYIDRVLDPSEVFKLPRLSYQECAEKVAADMQKAADLLPVDWDQTEPGKATLGKNNIRINKVMALAYLGKNLLWAGSPLMNQVSTGSSSYNVDYCKRAAEALGQALQICESTGRYQLADFADYTQLFYTRGQNGKLPGLKETIFYEHLIQYQTRFRWNQVNDYRPYSLINSGLGCYPTANFVNNYGMKNGLPIPDMEKADPESGYDPEHPWKDRDPRFYHDIMIDGERCVLDGSRVQNDPERQYASLYTGGTFRHDNPDHPANTGYMISKIAPKLLNIWDGYQDGNTMVLSLMRLADVYLLYAEATSQGYGMPQSKASSFHMTALEAVNKIRQRAGVDPVASKFTGDLDSFMSELRRERAVELAFEGHRFTDLRRWMLLLERPYTLKTRIDFDRDPATSDADRFANPQNARILNLRQVVILERKFSQKHYWFPFLKEDVNMYKELKQNPGW